MSVSVVGTSLHSTFFCSVSDFSLTNKFHATEVTPTLEMSSSICSGWSFCIGVMTIAKCHLKQ